MDRGQVDTQLVEHSDKQPLYETGRSFKTPAFLFGTKERTFTFLEGFNRYGVLIS